MLRAGQLRLLADALPLFSTTSEALAAGRAFAGSPREIWLEIGFGAGEHLLEQAKANPDVGIVGCEPFLNGVVAALVGLERERLSNVRLRRGDAQAVIEEAPDRFFSRVFMLYPDPWPKRRHHKRRLVAVSLIDTLARVMRGAPNCALLPTSTTMLAGHLLAFLLRLIFTGVQLDPTIGASPGLIGVRHVMRPRRVLRAEGPFTSLSCVYEKRAILQSRRIT